MKSIAFNSKILRYRKRRKKRCCGRIAAFAYANAQLYDGHVTVHQVTRLQVYHITLPFEKSLFSDA